MDKNIKQICKEIRSGRHLEEHIPLLFNYMAESYYTNASVRLAMHYFSYYENYCDDEGTWSKEALEYTDKINHDVHTKGIYSIGIHLPLLQSINPGLMNRYIRELIAMVKHNIMG